MNADELQERLGLVPMEDGGYRVSARESTDLEFKRELTLATFRKSLKTIAAFANKTGGCIVFGVSDKPRLLVGIGGNELDEGVQSEQVSQAISPMPITHFFTIQLHGRILGVLMVEPLPKPPSIAIRDIPGGQGEDPVLRKGTVYTRRRGQTAPITGEEFSQLLISRDERTRNEIFSYLSRGRDIGFDQVIVADPRSGEGDGEQEMTFYLPATAAAEMNVIDKGTLVEEGGSPAYKLVGNVQLSTPADKDPRKPMRAKDAADSIRPHLIEVFGDAFPWSYTHLRKAADHLGFWDNEAGDTTHTGIEPINNTTLYYGRGRDAVVQFAKQTPDDFIEVVGSRKTQEAWRVAQADAQAAANEDTAGEE
ncbi:MAG: hypothetical protein BM560_01095 [Roseobacter sp. MedPE-SWde]|nr:MAG: hypothetical protein BM560_01095 [Roseobacter sp. MedPE-SWde]